MTALLWATIAIATPDTPFPRLEAELRVRRYAEVRGDGPVTAHYRRRTGPIQAWTFTDGTVQRYELLDSGRLVEGRRFSATGAPLSTVVFGATGTPVSAAVLDADIDVSDWAVRSVGGASVTAPGQPETTRGTTTWTGERWRVTMQPLAEAADPFSDAFRDALAAHCGCTLLDRTTTWLDGRPAARYTMRLPDPDNPMLGELWAVRSGDQTLLIASLGSDRARLATGRAMTALLEWE